MTLAAPPPAKFRLERVDYGRETEMYREEVYADYGGATLHPRSVKIAAIWFDGDTWQLIKYLEFEDDGDGGLRPTGFSDDIGLNPDPEAWAKLRSFTNEVNEQRHARLPAVQEAYDARLKFERKQYMESTKEDALLLGTALARLHWRGISADM